MPGRILVIRGGAIGDFILTLPAIHLLRENFSHCHLEILGYKHICTLADRRFYANAIRSIEYAPMAGFFNPKADLDSNLGEYFASFNKVISYLYDPDHLFGSNLQRVGVKHLITASPKIQDNEHAAFQFARPLKSLALFLDDPAAHIYPSKEDLTQADKIFEGLTPPFVAIHPGSGSETKNWPLEQWRLLLTNLQTDKRVGHILLIGGESDAHRICQLKLPFQQGLSILENLPLSILGAVLSRCALFIGHDSGISHLAAAAGTRCLLMFGPTDPSIWAPANSKVSILKAPDLDLCALEFRDVMSMVDDLLEHV